MNAPVQQLDPADAVTVTTDDRCVVRMIHPDRPLPPGIDPAALGAKAWNLARMAALGLPVPPGFVIGTGWCVQAQALEDAHWRPALQAWPRRRLMAGSCRPLPVMVFFDRSWYNRAGVERVMGLCTDDEYEEFFRSVPEFERLLVRSGIQLIKYWFSITDEEQHFRFLSRIHDPLKQRPDGRGPRGARPHARCRPVDHRRGRTHARR